MLHLPLRSTLFPYTTLFRSPRDQPREGALHRLHRARRDHRRPQARARARRIRQPGLHQPADQEDLRHHRFGENLRHLRRRAERHEGSGVDASTHALEVSSHGTVELKIPGRAEWVAVARLAVAAVASRLRFSVDEIEDIKLAIAEACTNSIQSAGGVDAGVIEIVCDALENELRVTVRDNTPGLHLEPVKPGGIDEERTEELGVFLIRALMDSVDYTSDPRRGTQLVIAKRVSS